MMLIEVKYWFNGPYNNVIGDWHCLDYLGGIQYLSSPQIFSNATGANPSLNNRPTMVFMCSYEIVLCWLINN